MVEGLSEDSPEAPEAAALARKHRRIAFVINGAAGTAARTSREAIRETVASVLRAHYSDVEVSFVESADIGAAIEGVAGRAIGGELDAVAVGGGDGTIRSVAAVLAGTDVPLGILPLGTRNHFARDLGLPLELEAAIRTIVTGRVCAVDIGEVNGELFINNSSIGIYPHMVVDREKRNGNGAPKWLATIFSFFRALHRFPRRRLRVRVEGVAAAYRTPCLFVGNNEYDTDFLSLGRKQLDAGKLYLYVARPASPLAFLWLALKLGLGGVPADLDRIEADSAEVASRASRLLVALDGEVATIPTPLRYRSRPGALKVIVPREA